MRCELIQPHLGAYLDGELDEPLRADVDGHLEECRECRETVRDMRLASEVLHKWRTATTDVSMVETVRRRLLEEDRQAGSRPTVELARSAARAGRDESLAVRVLALAASLLLVLGVGWVTWRSLGSGRPAGSETVASLGRALAKVDNLEDLHNGGIVLQGVIGEQWASPRPGMDALVQLEVAGTMLQTASEASQGSDVGKILGMLGREGVASRLRGELENLADAAGAFGAALLSGQRAMADEPPAEEGDGMEEAMRLEEQGDLGAALDKYKEAALSRVLEIHSLVRQAGLEMKLDRARDAVETLKRAYERTKPDTFNRELVTELRQRAEQAVVLRAKIDELKGKLANTESEFEALTEIGNLEVRAGNLTGAKETCDRIIVEFADSAHAEGNLRARLLRAWCLREMNRYAEASEEFDRVITDAAGRYPDLAMLAQYERAKTFQLRGRFAQAVDDYTGLANTQGITPASYAALEFQVGYIFLHDIGDAREAMRIFKQLDQGAYRDQPFGRLAVELASAPQSPD